MALELVDKLVADLDDAREIVENLEIELIEMLEGPLIDWVDYLLDPKTATTSAYVESISSCSELPTADHVQGDFTFLEAEGLVGWNFQHGTFPFSHGLFMPRAWITDRTEWVKTDQAGAAEKRAARRAEILREINEITTRQDREQIRLSELAEQLEQLG